jgi:integrase
LKGQPDAVRNFAISADTIEERQRQLAEAKSWSEETRRQMLAGVRVSTHEAETTTLRDVMKRYEIKASAGRRETNIRDEKYRFDIILADPIADCVVAQLRKSHLAAFRDRRIDAGWAKAFERAATKLESIKLTPAERRKREAEVKALPTLYRQVAAAKEPTVYQKLNADFNAICEREGISGPAKTTISNTTQLITRALRFAGETMEGVPDLSGVSMPQASPGRERRVSAKELEILLGVGEQINSILPLIVRFAIETALRKDRVLTIRRDNVRDIGGGRNAIVFPRETGVRTKRTGVIPVTREIADIIRAAETIRGTVDSQDSIFGVGEEAFDSMWRRLLGATKIEDLHFHDFRHEATSRLFERGLTTAEVMSVTGHSTTEMVDRYSHYSAGHVFDKLERGQGTEALMAEIEFLADQYRALGGDVDAMFKRLVLKHSSGEFSAKVPSQETNKIW